MLPFIAAKNAPFSLEILSSLMLSSCICDELAASTDYNIELSIISLIFVYFNNLVCITDMTYPLKITKFTLFSKFMLTKEI